MNDSEEYRRACEARHVMKLSNDRRQAYYEGVLKQRGKDAANDLIDDVNKLRKHEVAKNG